MKDYLKKAQFYLFLLTVASIPFPVVFNRYLIYALSAVTLAMFDWEMLKQNFFKEKRILLGGSIALLNLFGLLYTSNLHSGFSLLERSAITLIIPVIILMVTPTEKEVNLIFYFFSSVCLAVCFYCLLYSFYRMFESGSLINVEKISDRTYYYFINNELTSKAMGISPIYLGLYVNFSIAFLLTKIFMRKDRRRGDVLLLVILHFFQGIIFSLSAILALLLLWMIVLLKIAADKTVAQRVRGSLAFLAILLICLIGIYRIKPLHDRVFLKLQYNFEYAHVSYWTGITLRLGVWECALEAVKESPLFGNGTGDANDILLEKYREKKFLLAEYMKLNAHNQYLQSYLMHGVPGVIVILSLLFVPFYQALKEKNGLLIMFMAILFLGFFTEVLLGVQKGLVFFSIFFPLLYLPPGENK